MWISPKPMVDGFVKITDEFRNGYDEKSVTIKPNSPHRNLTKFPNLLHLHLLTFTKSKKNFANCISGKSTKNLKLPTLEFKF